MKKSCKPVPVNYGTLQQPSTFSHNDQPLTPWDAMRYVADPSDTCIVCGIALMGLVCFDLF